MSVSAWNWVQCNQEKKQVVEYECEKCEYKTNLVGALKSHKSLNHGQDITNLEKECDNESMEENNEEEEIQIYGSVNA